MVKKGIASCWSVLLVLLTNFPYREAYTFSGQANVTTTVTGRPFFFCDYNGIQWTKGTVWFADDCTRVSCDGGSMSGAGYGIHAGVIGLPDGCSLYKDGCDPLPWTVINGTKVTCFKHELIPGMNV